MSARALLPVCFACVGFTWMGCYSVESISRQSISHDENLTIVRVVTVEDSVISFQDVDGEYGILRDSVISGIPMGAASGVTRTSKGDRIYSKTEVPLARVAYIEARKVDLTLTLFALAGGILVAGAVAIASIGPIHAGI